VLLLGKSFQLTLTQPSSLLIPFISYEDIYLSGVPFPVELKKDISSRGNKNSFYISFNLTAFVGLPVGKMSGCCSVKMRITPIEAG
jgi:hypothetical protein